MRIALIPAIAILFISLSGSAVISSQPGPAAISGQDGFFLIEALKSGRFKEDLGKSASIRAAGGEVRQFGLHVMNDFARANRYLGELSDARAIRSAPLGEVQRRTLDWFRILKGAEFDREFMSLMIDEFNADLELYRNEVRSGTDSELKTFAGNRIPVLEKYRESAQAILDRIPGPLLK